MTLAKRARGDRLLMGGVLALLGVGSVTVFSSSTTISAELSGSSVGLFMNHMGKIGLGLGLLVALSRIDYRVLKRLVLPMVGLSVAMMVVLLIPDFPLAVSVKGARRWIDLGFLVVQPAEVAKISLVVYVSYKLSQGSEKIRDYRRGFAPILTVLAVFVGLLMAQPNFGNVLTLSILTAILLFVGGARLDHLATSGVATMPLVGFLALQRPHVVSRFGAFLDPAADPFGSGFQLRQSLLAFGHGGVFGLGPGGGRQSEYFLPDCHTDFAFAVLGEDFGLFGTLGTVALFALVCARGVSIARTTSDPFGRHLAVGLTAMIGVAAVLNMAVTLGLAPTAGLPLPFVSYGGSAMLVNLGAVGILLSIARRSQERPVVVRAKR